MKCFTVQVFGLTLVVTLSLAYLPTNNGTFFLDPHHRACLSTLQEHTDHQFSILLQHPKCTPQPLLTYFTTTYFTTSPLFIAFFIITSLYPRPMSLSLSLLLFFPTLRTQRMYPMLRFSNGPRFATPLTNLIGTRFGLGY